MKKILIALVCLMSLSSYASEEEVSNLSQSLPTIPEGGEFVETQTPLSDVSDSGYHVDHELLLREISDGSDSSVSSISLSPVLNRPVSSMDMEVFIHNGNLVVSFKEGVWTGFPKVMICQGGVMMEYQRNQGGYALIHPEVELSFE